MLKKKTYKAYSGLAKYCRTGDATYTDNIALRKDRIHHYRRLVFNITNNSLKQAFPICFKLFSKDQWNKIVADFFEQHNNQEYRIWMMPKEFYGFAKEQDYASRFAVPFLNDLLLFEWIEIEVHTMPDESPNPFDTYGNLWSQQLVLNPEYRLLQLEYPVHIKKTIQISHEDKGSYFLFAYRDKKTKGVQFMNLSVLYAYIIEQLEEKHTLEQIVKNYCKLSKSEFNNSLKSDVEAFINKMKIKSVIFGFAI